MKTAVVADELYGQFLNVHHGSYFGGFNGSIAME
jgi:hypothetical protein